MADDLRLALDPELRHALNLYATPEGKSEEILQELVRECLERRAPNLLKLARAVAKEPGR